MFHTLRCACETNTPPKKKVSWADRLSKHRISGWRAVSDAGLQGDGSRKRTVVSTDAGIRTSITGLAAIASNEHLAWHKVNSRWQTIRMLSTTISTCHLMVGQSCESRIRVRKHVLSANRRDNMLSVHPTLFVGVLSDPLSRGRLKKVIQRDRR